METKKYMGPERRGGGDRRESSCPMTEEQAYKMMFTLDKLAKDQEESKVCLKELLDRLAIQEDNEMKRMYAGKMLLGLGTIVLYMIGWGVDHIREIGIFLKAFNGK